MISLSGIIVSPYVLVLFVVGFVVITYRYRRPKLNEPPLVPYKYPLIGHSLDFKRNPEEFLKQCHKKYGNTFSVYLARQIYTVLSNNPTYELFKSDDFSLTNAVYDRFPFLDIIGATRYPSYTDSMSVMIRDNLYGHLANYQPRIQYEVQYSIDQLIGDCKETKIIDSPEEIVRNIVARTVANVFVGEKLCRDPEVLETFATFPTVLEKTLKVPHLVYFIHPSLHRAYIRLLFKFGNNNNPVQRHKNILIRKLKPVFEKRQQAMQQHGHKETNCNNLIQAIIDHSLNLFGEIQPDYIACFLLTLIFTATHTITSSILNTLAEFVERPEYWKDLREEQESIAGDLETKLDGKKLNEMKKLDSFLKESARLLWLPCRIVFQNNIAYINDSSLHGNNPETFSGFRYVDNDDPLTMVGRSSLAFGLGKHACPGRWFAANTMKTALSILIRKYDISKLDQTRRQIVPGQGTLAVIVPPLKFKNRK
ncbi:419_t:CDS:2 [Paraglomus occultum]|uniref:419_t:CDS:1 n=1 Tax=Paraglomus occultum TaxID=144539 RepID=A0A9N9GNX1_9GLOM|nr:419_t:CDS:2 [Paraglomus occultum]